MNDAEMNKGMVAEQQSTYGYEEQERILRGWAFGTMPPKGLLLGELVTVPKNGRVPEHHDAEYRQEGYLGY